MDIALCMRMCPFWFVVLTAVVVLTGTRETHSFRVEFQALDAMEPLLRFQKPLESVDKEKDGQPQILADALLSLGFTPSGNISEPCRAIMKDLAEQGGDFAHCLLSHARPFRMCEECVVQYTYFTHLYEDLLNDDHCAPVLLLADRMQVLTSVYNTFTSVWSSADCPKCYENVEENSTTGVVSFNYTSDTLLFQAMNANVSKCFNDSDIVDDRGVNAVCTDCLSVYRTMNDKFSAVQSSSDGHICMDLIDMMNYTRLMWSIRFKCTRPRPDASVVITLTVIIVIITVLLYFTSRFIAKIRMPQIFKAKRMMTSSSRYGSISHEGADRSLPRLAANSPSFSTTVERRRVDNDRDVDGNGCPRISEQRT